MKTNKCVHLFLFEYEPQFSDGRIVRIKALVNYLASRGVPVCLYSLSDDQRIESDNGVTHFQIKFPGMGMVKCGNVAAPKTARANFLRKIMLTIGRTMFPDRYVFSIPLVYWKLRKEVREGDTLIISMPWFSALLLTLFPIFSRRNVSLILDYRDLWVNNMIFVKGRLQSALASWLENAALRRCKAVSVTTTSAASYFEEKGINTILVSNGISQSDLMEIAAAKNSSAAMHRPKNKPLLLGYFGNLGNRRECKKLLQRLIESGIELSVYGTLDPPHRSVCGQYFHGSVDRQVGLARAAECDYLLIVIRKSENSDYAIPGKVYESIVLMKPLLVFCPSDAIVLGYLREISYPHFHVDSEEVIDLVARLGEFLLYAKGLDKALLSRNYAVPIREHEFQKFEEYLF